MALAPGTPGEEATWLLAPVGVRASPFVHGEVAGAAANDYPGIGAVVVVLAAVVAYGGRA